jgi:hypothetical protein
MSRKYFRQIFGILSLASALGLAATQAEAHARLVSAEPAADAEVTAPETIVLHFDEPLQAALSSLKLTDIDGNPVVVSAATAPDASSLAAQPDMPLVPGLYTVSWTVAGADAHPMQGSISFTVK